MVYHNMVAEVRYRTCSGWCCGRRGGRVSQDGPSLISGPGMQRRDDAEPAVDWEGLTWKDMVDTHGVNVNALLNNKLVFKKVRPAPRP